jgi:hypothetical protein
VDIHGEQTFAGAGFAGDENGGLGVGDGMDQLHELFHLAVPKKQGLLKVPGFQALFQGLIGSHEFVLVEGALDGHPKAQIVNGFGDVIIGAELDGLHRAVDVAMAGDKNHQGVGI